MKQNDITVEQSPLDNLDMNPKYQEELQEMDFFIENDPEFAELMQSVKNGNHSLPRGS